LEKRPDCETSHCTFLTHAYGLGCQTIGPTLKAQAGIRKSDVLEAGFYPKRHVQMHTQRHTYTHHIVTYTFMDTHSNTYTHIYIHRNTNTHRHTNMHTWTHT
jgi:hypothetical protein